MNKVITINLGGTAFQLEEAGYDALRAYLDAAKARLQGNPDRDEILSDIERALADKFRSVLSAFKNVVLDKEVLAALEELGPVQDDAAAAGAASSSTHDTNPAGAAKAEATGEEARSTPKRLYRVQEGAMLAGVCSGIGAYFNIDPTFVRLAFVLLTIVWGTGLLVYVVMAFVVPMAVSPEEKAAAHGMPATAQDFIRRAKQGYYDAVKSFPDRQARREWKRRFKQDMREWRTNFHREMASNAEQWRCGWHGPIGPGAGFALPFVSLVHGALAIGLICALISLLGTGAVFGIGLPAGLPVWGALFILLVVYGILVWPLKAARHAFYRGGPGAGWSALIALDAFIWIAVIAALLWLAYRFFPQTHEAFQNIPTVAHDFADTIRDWWNRK